MTHQIKHCDICTNRNVDVLTLMPTCKVLKLMLVTEQTQQISVDAEINNSKYLGATVSWYPRHDLTSIWAACRPQHQWHSSDSSDIGNRNTKVVFSCRSNLFMFLLELISTGDCQGVAEYLQYRPCTINISTSKSIYIVLILTDPKPKLIWILPLIWSNMPSLIKYLEHNNRR